VRTSPTTFGTRGYIETPRRGDDVHEANTNSIGTTIRASTILRIGFLVTGRYNRYV
jgi:hypothetical protein